MKLWKVGAVVLGAAALAGAGAMLRPAVAQGGVTWGTDFDAAALTARETGKPIFLVFR